MLDGGGADLAGGGAVNGDSGGCACTADRTSGFEPTLLEGGRGEFATGGRVKGATGQGTTPAEA